MYDFEEFDKIQVALNSPSRSLSQIIQLLVVGVVFFHGSY